MCSDGCVCCAGYLRVFAMKHGVVGIRGVTAGLYLCMKADGVVYGSVSLLCVCVCVCVCV